MSNGINIAKAICKAGGRPRTDILAFVPSENRKPQRSERRSLKKRQVSCVSIRSSNSMEIKNNQGSGIYTFTEYISVPDRSICMDAMRRPKRFRIMVYKFPGNQLSGLQGFKAEPSASFLACTF